MPSTDDDQPDAPPPPTPSADVSPFAPASPFAEYLQPPRLGIIHLLAWTAVTAVLLKFGQAMEMLQANAGPSSGPAVETVLKITRSAYAAIHAAGVVGAAILLMTKIRRTPGSFQPGHWILLINTAAMLMFYLRWVLWVLLKEFHLDETTWHLLSIALVELLYAGGYVVAIWKARAPARWKAYFLLLVLAILLESLIYVVIALTGQFDLLPWGSSIVLSAIVGVVLLAVVLLDLLKRAGRDWLHWTGVAAVAAGVLLQIGWWVAMKLIEPELAAW